LVLFITHLTGNSEGDVSVVVDWAINELDVVWEVANNLCAPFDRSRTQHSGSMQAVHNEAEYELGVYRVTT
jgi:hypothetical protein